LKLNIPEDASVELRPKITNNVANNDFNSLTPGGMEFFTRTYPRICLKGELVTVVPTSKRSVLHRSHMSG